MDQTSIKQYLQHYGKIRTLRGSVVRSTFKRVVAAFDEYDEATVNAALRILNPKLNPTSLTCVYCGNDATCWDHLVPAALGGTHQLKNLVPSCTACNNEKGSKDWETFLTKRNIDQNSSLWKRISLYASGYEPSKTLVSPVEQCELDRLLNEIHKLMEQADAIVQKALLKHRTNARVAM